MRKKIGAHFRVIPSLEAVVKRAEGLELSVFQNFLIDQETGKKLKLSPEEIERFKEITKKFHKKFVHAAYWINLASGKTFGGQHILKRELALAEKLGYDGVVLHPGSAVGQEKKEDGIAAIVRRLNRLLKDSSMTILLENTAHGNRSIGGSLEDLKAIRDQVEKKDQIKFCIDTAHAHSYGYDLSSKEGVDTFIASIDKLLELENVHLIHFNDSKEAFNSKKDRHEVPGRGAIGEGMKFVLHHPDLVEIPFMLELSALDDEETKKVIEDINSWER